MTVNAITDTKKGRTGIAPTYLHTTQKCDFGGCHCVFVNSSSSPADCQA